MIHRANQGLVRVTCPVAAETGSGHPGDISRLASHLIGQQALNRVGVGGLIGSRSGKNRSVRKVRPLPALTTTGRKRIQTSQAAQTAAAVGALCLNRRAKAGWVSSGTLLTQVAVLTVHPCISGGRSKWDAVIVLRWSAR